MDVAKLVVLTFSPKRDTSRIDLGECSKAKMPFFFSSKQQRKILTERIEVDISIDGGVKYFV